ncbi:hypothetical protein [Massilia sp. Leaf139]|uniref:hypothetical protein n=1 Tax=Massilia sp. Leaf139 TaxID=1736272 RepID=UPI0006F80CE8|nr:hypothetical protein [Massilia sp. Leaf139]
MHMDAGTKIVRAGELIENVWKQAYDLGNSLRAITESGLKNNEFDKLQIAGKSNLRYQQSLSGWSTTSSSISIPVMERNRRKMAASAWINYQISVFGGGLPPLGDGHGESIGPVLHVSFWRHATDFKDEEFYVTFPPNWNYWEVKDERLIFWDSEQDGKYPQWTFSLRLLELDSEHALRTSVLAPIKALLAKAEPAAALPANLPGLIFYANDETGLNLVASRP